MTDAFDLTGKLLIAMPGMGDPRFVKSVIYICACSPEGAMGLIVNKHAPEISLARLLAQLKIPAPRSGHEIRVHVGGPVEHGRGFVLHSDDYAAGGATLHVDGKFAMTATVDILQAIAGGEGPRRSFLALGYSGWGPGQIEAEIGANGWLTCDASDDLIFSGDNDTKWVRALATLGVSPVTLSPASGRA